MSDKKSSSGSSDIGFGGLLTVALIVLKLTGHIDWSWWWVLAPTWIPIAIVLLIMAGGAFIILAANLLAKVTH